MYAHLPAALGATHHISRLQQQTGHSVSPNEGMALVVVLMILAVIFIVNVAKSALS